MTASSSVVKLTARTALKNNWLKAIAACMTVISVFIIISGIASLISYVGGDTAAYICEAILCFLLLFPLTHGLVRFFWRLLFGADDYLLKPFRDQELTHAVARVCRRMQPVSAAPAPKEKEPEATGYVRQAMDYIAAHYADADISIAVIAEHLRVSEGHLSHVFKKQTGMTVTNYLPKTRIDAAMRMLSRDHVKVYEAAAAVGYKDVTYFSATFKKLTGLSPSEVE